MPEGDTQTQLTEGQSASIAKQSRKDALSFDYDSFLRRMRHPDCRQLVSEIKSFIGLFKDRATTGASTAQQVRSYREFIQGCAGLIRENPVWRLVGDADEREYDLAMEGVEYLVMNQLYIHAFSPSSETGAEDRGRDEQIQQKISLYGEWIKPFHLDISALFSLNDDNTFWNNAISEFKRVSEYYTPRDKLICLLNGCQLLQAMVQQTRGEESMSADEMLPIIIYAVIKSRPAQLASNLLYVSRFRDPRRLANASAYHFTTLLAASSFIERLDRTTLQISPEEHDHQVEAALAQLNAEALQTEVDRSAAIELTRRESPLLPRRSPDLTEEAVRVFDRVKEKIKRGANKSIDILGKWIEGAEAKVREHVGSGSSTPDSEAEREKALVDEEEYQLQLAMALSISDLDSKQLPMSSTSENLVDIGLEEHNSEQFG